MKLIEQDFVILLLIIVRITGFIYTAPFFSLKNVPFRVKTGLAIFLSIILLMTVSHEPVEYASLLAYTVLIVKEVLVGAIMGFFANIAYHIVSFAGQLIDMEIGFSMVQTLDPMTNIQTTITSNLYGYLVILIMLVTKLHHYFLKAIIDSFQVIPIGKGYVNPNLYQLMMQFITDYFIIGFRITLPIFAAILVTNTVLAILAKVAPNMNMFVIGLQLKIFVGIFILVLIVEMVPSVADFIFNEMIGMLRASVELLIGD